MKKLIILFGILLICTIVIFSTNKENINGLVLYKSEVSSYDTLKKHLNQELGINLNVDYVIDENGTFEEYDFWEYSRVQLTNKLNENDIDLLLDIPNEYLRDYIKNENIFNAVKVSFDSIEWPNEADIDPETLYEDSVSYSS